MATATCSSPAATRKTTSTSAIPAAPYLARPLLLKNLLRETGQARFVNVSDRCGDGLRVAGAGRGACFDDLDNDGDLDVVVLNSRGHRRSCATCSQRISAPESLAPGSPPRDRRRTATARERGSGSMAGDLVQIDEVHHGRGYQSHWGTRLHFGLGRTIAWTGSKFAGSAAAGRCGKTWPPTASVTLIEGQATPT